MLCPAPPANQPPSPDGKPPLHEVLQPIASYVEAHLTPAQLAQLERDWQAYQAAVLRGREARLAAATRLQYGAAVHSLSWQKQATTASGGSTAERSEARLNPAALSCVLAGLLPWAACLGWAAGALLASLPAMLPALSAPPLSGPLLPAHCRPTARRQAAPLACPTAPLPVRAGPASLPPLPPARRRPTARWRTAQAAWTRWAPRRCWAWWSCRCGCDPHSRMDLICA